MPKWYPACDECKADECICLRQPLTALSSSQPSGGYLVYPDFAARFHQAAAQAQAEADSRAVRDAACGGADADLERSCRFCAYDKRSAHEEPCRSCGKGRACFEPAPPTPSKPDEVKKLEAAIATDELKHAGEVLQTATVGTPEHRDATRVIVKWAQTINAEAEAACVEHGEQLP